MEPKKNIATRLNIKAETGVEKFSGLVYKMFFFKLSSTSYQI